MLQRVVTTHLVRAHGEIDADTAPRLRRQLLRGLAAHPEVVLDLSDVTFMDCAGLRVLVEARGLADRKGGRLLLRGVGTPVARLLHLTGLQSLADPSPPRPRHPASGRSA
ncbi:STAS domain-containing protein [Kitasatospora sp. NPDC057198]|uniref:STAS domain-containing protein n=1 Tax=Kitasatospora sp. NPDC057198 TaxID=3346046 RepID=UPI003632581F